MTNEEKAYQVLDDFKNNKLDIVETMDKTLLLLTKSGRFCPCGKVTDTKQCKCTDEEISQM